MLEVLVNSSSDVHYQEYMPLPSQDKQKCVLMADVFMLQCILVFVGSISVLYCFWTPDAALCDLDMLARIMYLFDSKACNYKLESSREFSTIVFKNITADFHGIQRITWRKPSVTVSTRLSVKTRKYIQFSLSLHCIWLVICLVTRICCKRCDSAKILKIVLMLFFYSCTFMIIFDVSMALVYIAHIKQSLTMGMILRYSGWSTTKKLNSYEDFGGWLPIAASCCWLRGVLIFFLNIYFCRSIKLIRRKIKRREIKRKYSNEGYKVIPEPQPVYKRNDALVYRASSDGASHFYSDFG